MIGPLLFSVLVALAVVILFVGLWRTLSSLDPVEARLQEFGASVRGPAISDEDAHEGRRRPAWRLVNRLLTGFGLGPRLAAGLARADLPLTAAEFALIMLGAGVVGLVIGAVRLGLVVGLALAPVCGFLPYLYLGVLGNRRVRAFTEQLPDVLTLLVGSLRSGYGLSQSIELLVEQLPPPVSKEFGRVMRAMVFGMPVQVALTEMAERVGSDDLDLVVTAINVQHEMGGNLADTLETIGETVRERIRIQREIQVLTAQQRITGYFLAVWPVVLAFGMFMLNPDYMGRLFEPDMRWLPAVAVVMMILGFLAIRRIVDIEV